MGLLRRSSQWDPPALLDRLLISPLTFIITFIHHILTRLRGAPFKPPLNRAPIKVVCISDTHGHYPTIPSGDLLIHAGDLTNSGKKEDIQKTVDWLNTQPHRYIVVVAGNHDNYLDPAGGERLRERRGSTTKTSWNSSGKHIHWGKVIYLHHTSAHLRFKGGRTVEIYGAPGIPFIEAGDKHAFQYTPGNEPWLHHPIPPSIDILVTHTPPLGHLDIGLGCPSLLSQIWLSRPRLHVFGHVHSGHGQEAIFWDPAQAAFERLKASDAAYEQEGSVKMWWWRAVKAQRWLDAARVLGWGVRNVVWRWLMQGPRGARGALLVNAAMTYRSTSRIGNEAQVVYL